MINLHNTHSRKIEPFKPLEGDKVRMYSCGPTVYDHIHIGNLSAFIYADVLRRMLANTYAVRHVMNFTDVDDKTIRRSQEQHPDLSSEEALQTLTKYYGDIFLNDMQAIGNDTETVEFVYATKSIEGMRQLITELYNDGFAYVAEDGVYFSIEKYRASGKTYGQLTEITDENTSESRVANDEYDKDSVHDFALWKTKKGNEPAWDFELDGHNLTGRPGWHIECSVMSSANLGKPFDIHTGGIDLIFPHHENEIAQSTAGSGDIYAAWFVHNQHLLVDGKKMSKSLNNFYTLRDIQERGFDPIAFRLVVLQSHYRSQSSFSWKSIEAAQNNLRNIQSWADLQFQDFTNSALSKAYEPLLDSFTEHMQNDLKTPATLAVLNEIINITEELGPDSTIIKNAVKRVDAMLNLELTDRSDISKEAKELLSRRSSARTAKDWATSDELRDTLADHGITVRDAPYGQAWSR